MGKTSSMIKEYAFIAFTLLGILFGMMIMTFIFGQLGSNAVTINDISASVSNETGSWLNATTYTVSNSGIRGFNTLAITAAINATDNTTIGVGNFTVSGAGFTNSTQRTWSNVAVSYTYNYYSDQRIATDTVQNESLQGIVSYTSGSTTQFNTISIAIILVILIGVFLVFWKIFVSKSKNKTSSSGGSFG